MCAICVCVCVCVCVGDLWILWDVGGMVMSGVASTMAVAVSDIVNKL